MPSDEEESPGQEKALFLAALVLAAFWSSVVLTLKLNGALDGCYFIVFTCLAAVVPCIKTAHAATAGDTRRTAAWAMIVGVFIIDGLSMLGRF